METITIKFSDKTKNIQKDILTKIPFFEEALKFENNKNVNRYNTLSKGITHAQVLLLLLVCDLYSRELP